MTSKEFHMECLLDGSCFEHWGQEVVLCIKQGHRALIHVPSPSEYHVAKAWLYCGWRDILRISLKKRKPSV